MQVFGTWALASENRFRPVWGRFPRNTRKACGQCAPGVRKILPPAASIAGGPEALWIKKPIFHWIFHDGTEIAHRWLSVGRPRFAASVGVLPCCLLLAPRRPRWTLSNR